MIQKLKISVTIFLLIFVFSQEAKAQNGVGPYDTILTYAKIVGNDTFPMIYLNEFTEFGSMTQDQKDYWKRLRYNVYKVYPYALQTASIVDDIDAQLDRLPNEKAKKKYLKTREGELKEKFKKPLKDLTVSQGKILVKLINRETGKNVYGMLKNYKSGFKARVSQTAAHFFDNDLKATYDPEYADRDIETIIQEIESKGHFKNLRKAK